MTLEQWIEENAWHIGGSDWNTDDRDAFNAVIRAAVEWEREECAKECDAEAAETLRECGATSRYHVPAESCAVRIRARSQK